MASSQPDPVGAGVWRCWQRTLRFTIFRAALSRRRSAAPRLMAGSVRAERIDTWDPRTAEASRDESCGSLCFTRLQHATRLGDSLCTSGACMHVECHFSQTLSMMICRRRGGDLCTAVLRNKACCSWKQTSSRCTVGRRVTELQVAFIATLQHDGCRGERRLKRRRRRRAFALR